MNKAVLKTVEMKVIDVLSSFNQIQYEMDSVSKGEDLEISIRIRPMVGGNTCPNYSDSGNGCEKCSYAVGWHLVEGRCQPKEGVDEPDDYRLLKIHRNDYPKIRKGRKRDGKKVVTINKDVEEAVWV